MVYYECKTWKKVVDSLKKRIYICFLILNTVLTLTLLLFTGIIRTLVDIYLPLGALLVLTIVISIVFILEAVMLIFMISMMRSVRAKILSTVLLIAVSVFVIFFPATQAYGIVNYRLCYDIRAEFIESVGDVNKNYSQIDMETYFINDIRISYSGSVIVHSENDETVIIFDVFSGFAGQSALIYSSVPREISAIDTDLGEISTYFKNIRQINNHWYYGES